MCGRFVVARAGEELVSVLRADVISDELPAPSFNIAPTDRATIVLDSIKSEPPLRRVEAARWGLVPGWAKDLSVGARAFNARAEELEQKPMFRNALIARRAIVPCSGWYEWKTGPAGKVPHYLHSADDAPIFLAGLYEWWRDRARADDDPARWVLSFTILTRSSTGALTDIHDRMPLMVDADHADAWLDPSTENVGDILDAAMDAAPGMVQTLDDRVVATAVGNVRNNGPQLIEPATDAG